MSMSKVSLVSLGHSTSLCIYWRIYIGFKWIYDFVLGHIHSLPGPLWPVDHGVDTPGLQILSSTCDIFLSSCRHRSSSSSNSNNSGSNKYFIKMGCVWIQSSLHKIKHIVVYFWVGDVITSQWMFIILLSWVTN